jgi:hypothetical protein
MEVPLETKVRKTTKRRTLIVKEDHDANIEIENQNECSLTLSEVDSTMRKPTDADIDGSP